MVAGNKKIKSDLTKRFEPSKIEIKKYNFPLTKQSLNEVPGGNYLSESLLNTLSEFCDHKDMDWLTQLDLFILYKSISQAFSEEVTYNEIKKFRKENGLSRFGIAQYELMKDYFRYLKDPNCFDTFLF